MVTKLFRLTCLVPLVVLALVWVSPGSSTTLAQADSGPTEVELVGFVEALGTDTVVVNGWLVSTLGAEMNTPLELDMAVKVEGNLQADASILAREINSADEGLQPGEVEIVGQLESLDASTLVISGLAIDVANAELQDAVVAGDMVKVHAMLSSDGLWLAREVELFGDDDDEQTVTDDTTPRPEGEFEIVGTLDEISGTTLVISGQVISIETAEIKGALVLGTLVKIHVSFMDNELVAREVELSAGSDDAETEITQGEFEIVGVLGEVGSDFIVVSGQTISIVGAEINDPLVAGMLVKVHFSQVNGELVAREVEAFTPVSDDNGNDNLGDDNGNDNGNDNIGDDNGNDNFSDDNGNDNVSDDNGNDNIGDDNGNDNTGSDDSGNDNSGGDDNGGDDNGGDNSGSGGGGDDSGGDDDGGDDD